MSSFVRRTQLTHPEPGGTFEKLSESTKGCYSNSSDILLTSTGVPSLDRLLADGIPVGTVLGIHEDQPRSTSNYASILLKCIIAEGILCGQHVAILEGDSVEPNALLKTGLPAPAMSAETKEAQDPVASMDEKMTIAWRYKHLKQLDQELPPSRLAAGRMTNKGTSPVPQRSFDLGRKVNVEECQRSTGSKLKLSSTMEEGFMERFWQQCQELIVAAKESKTMVRIVLHSVGSPVQNPQDTKNLLYRLCALVHSNPENCILFFSTPAYTLNTCQPTLLADLESFCDVILSLRQFPPETAKQNKTLTDMYGGLMRFVKPLRVPGMLSLMIPETNDLAFKVKRRHLLFEPFCLPPDLSESPSRVASSGGGGAGCNSLTSKNLDF